MKNYGMYSKKMEELSGIIIYKDKDGNEVKCTGIGHDKNCKTYKWDDKILLGEVFDFVRRESDGIRGLNERI